MNLGSLKVLAEGYRHFCYVTDDIDQSLNTFALMGVQRLEKNYANGSPDQPMKMVFALADLGGGSQIEILQPLSKGNTYADFLDRHGRGLHHIGFRVPNFDEVYQTLVDQGCVPVQEGRGMFRGREVHMCYFDCSKIGAPMIEIAGITQAEG